MGRMRDNCDRCGEFQLIASHGLCFRCYRRQERAKKEAENAVATDRHNPGIRKEHRTLFKGFNSVMAGLGDLRVTRGDVLRIRTILTPYLAPIESYLKNEDDQVGRGHTESI